jgi:hypothetical protein
MNTYSVRIPGAYPAVGEIFEGFTYFSVCNKISAILIAREHNIQGLIYFGKSNGSWREWNVSTQL